MDFQGADGADASNAGEELRQIHIGDAATEESFGLPPEDLDNLMRLNHRQAGEKPEVSGVDR